MSLARDITANWAHLSELLDEVLLLPPTDRTSYLQGLTSRNAALGAILAQLLEIEQALPQRFLEDGPVMDMSVAPLAALHAGDEVGPYRLLSNLGSGGMASVWLAEKSDGSLKRKVALKLPRMPWMEGLTSQLLAERDILCALEHPHIARLYDAGLDTSGQPFIAMEYVEGAPIDEYCDRRGMSLTERVRLFLQVLEAVQYAHTRLVIHRDLKPANILINARGDAQLLDFGIAQLQPSISPSSSLELTSEAKEIRAHTLRYASPEQLRHQRLSVASDIYSLAVTLYELLTGSSPYGSAAESRESLTEAVLQGQLSLLNPSEFAHEALMCRRLTAKSLRRALLGDLGAILQKALAMDPSRRYVSAEAFAADLRRWLELRPVLARPPSAWYSFGKFLQRNPWPVAITSVSTLVISALITVALANANRAHMEYLRATATKDFLLNIFDAANPERHEGRDITARELLVLAEENIDSYISNNASLRTEILSSMIMLAVKVGDLDSAKRMLKERSSAYILLGEEQLSLVSILEEAHFSLLDGDFERLKFLVDRAKYLSRRIDVSDTEKCDIYFYEAWVDFDGQDYFGAINKFKASKSYSKGDVLRSVAAERGIANSFYRSGNPQQAIYFLNKSIADLDKYESDDPEKYFRKIEVLSDLYAIGEYKNGWKFAKSVISDEEFLNISNGYDLTKFYEIWVTWFLRVEGLEKLLEWANTNKENLKKIDAPATRLLWRVVEGQNTPRYALLEEVEAFSEVENVWSLEYLVFESELKIRIPSYSESAKLESDQRWGFSDARSKAYQLYFSAVHELSQGRFDIAANKFDSAYSAAIGVFGHDHPETMRVLLGKVATSYESRGILPDRELLSAIGDVLEGSYGGQSGEVQTVRWWLSEWGKSPSPSEILEKLRMTLYS